jgi:LysR substrate binding domain
VAVRVGDLADSSMMAIRLGSVSRVLVASPGYLEPRRTPKAPNDQSAHDIITFESLDATDEWRFGPTSKLVRVEPRLTVNSADAAIAAAEAGLGICRTLSCQVMASVLAGCLVPLLVSFTAEKLPVSAIYPARGIASTNLGAFIKNAREYFKTTRLFRSRSGRSRQAGTSVLTRKRLCRPPLAYQFPGGVALRVTGDPASAAASSRSRNASINARTRAGMCVRVGKTAHIPTSSGSASERTIRCNSLRAICLCTSQ